MRLYRYEKPACSRIDVLNRNEIWMSLPSAFNDPLDCQLKIIDKTDTSTFKLQRLKKAAIALYEDYFQDNRETAWLLTEEIVTAIREWAEGFDNASNPPHFLTLIQNRINGFGVQCFSELFDNPLMWSHYADAHRGFCIEYDLNVLDLAFGNCSQFAMSPTIYTSWLPKFDLNEVLFSPKEVTHKLYATKSAYWAYEREQRLIYFGDSPSGADKGQFVKLPNGLKITSIIIGQNASADVREKLSTVAKTLKVALEQMSTDERSYSLVKHSLK
jgi:Protein of unknown function (DUF2971)